jgi:hypothetical protein
MALVAVAAVASARAPHGLAWLVARPVLLIGIAGAAYAVVLAYTELPILWSAWSGR